jgi:6-phosphogluconolactonase
MKFVRIGTRLGIVPIIAILTLGLVVRNSAAAGKSTGFVYVATNAAANSVIQYARAADGSLTMNAEVLTGGSGTGATAVDPLGSQDSLVTSADGSLLVVVNAASNEVTSLRAGSGGLQVASTVSSNGTFPNSVAIRGDLVYVVNAQSTPNVTAFRVDASGALTAIPDSTRNLPGGGSAAPHDVVFSPDGTRLLVSEGGTNQIDVFQLDDNGLATVVTTSPSAGSGPFGMRFGRNGALIVVEAATASASSYVLTPRNTLTVVSAAVANGQAASCWISLAPDGKFGFVSDTGSGVFSSYQVSGNGMLNLASAVAASAGGGAPIDSSITGDGAFMYVVDSSKGRVLAYGIHGASLHPAGVVTGLPLSVQGIVAQ